MLVTALIVDQDIAWLAILADISEDISLTSMDVDIALALKQVEMINTFKTRFTIRSVFGAGAAILWSSWGS